MNILFITPALDPSFGGAPISEASLAQGLSKLGKVHVLCRRRFHVKEFSKKFGLEVSEFNPVDFLLGWLFPWCRSNQWLKGIDVVHLNGHWRWENFFVSRVCLHRNIPYVLHPRGMLLVWHRKILLKKIFNLLIGNSIVGNASKVIALSQFEIRHFAKYRVPANKIFIQPNGVNFSSEAKRFYENPLPETPKYLLYIGRLERRKNLIFLVDAFSEIVKEGVGLQLVLMGPAERGYDVKVKQRVTELGIESRVSFLPPVYGDAKWAFIQHATAVMYPSVEEPFGRVPFEAVAAGSQPVLPDLSGGREYLEPFIPENIYRSSDVASLTKVLRKVSQGQPKKLQEARNWVSRELDWDRVAKSVENLYRGLGP